MAWNHSLLNRKDGAQRSAPRICKNTGRSQFDPDDVHVDGIHDHAREPFHSVFYALFERFGDRIDGNAELDDDVNVDVDPVAVRRYAYALPFGAAAEQLGKAVRKTARYGFDDAVALRGGMLSHPRHGEVGYGYLAVCIARVYRHGILLLHLYFNPFPDILQEEFESAPYFFARARKNTKIECEID